MENPLCYSEQTLIPFFRLQTLVDNVGPTTTIPILRFLLSSEVKRTEGQKGIMGNNSFDRLFPHYTKRLRVGVIVSQSSDVNLDFLLLYPCPVGKPVCQRCL